MCPACIATAALIVGGGGRTAALAMKKLRGMTRAGETNPTTRTRQLDERLVFTSAALDGGGTPLFEVLNTVTFAEHGGKTTQTSKARIVKTTAGATPYLEGWKRAGHRAWNASRPT